MAQVHRTDATDIVITIACHHTAADAIGAMARDHGHIYALEQAAMTGANMSFLAPPLRTRFTRSLRGAIIDRKDVDDRADAVDTASLH
ncbi:hypothetical protein NY08_60 [Rhodococcus sp. B7740]|uniref:hypothetical protein n=1 Tax=Rhodococcus sp. B7740 TaxID=1564114 RepID=UPI0005DA222D|nr:hypothetical protein [Rhodococcus sp. B7740]AJW38093.1 hypothetical protein NY08_60 [Rhodococcus sp. B7740]